MNEGDRKEQPVIMTPPEKEAEPRTGMIIDIDSGQGKVRVHDVERARIQMHSLFADVLSPDASPDYRSHPEMQRIMKLHKFAFAIVTNARRANVPEPLIRRYASDFIAEKIAEKQFRIIADFLRNAKFGSPEEQATFERLALRQEAKLARQKRRKELREKEKTPIEQRDYLLLSPDATIADLARELDSDNVTDDMNEIFFGELHDGQYSEEVPKLLELMNTPQAASIRIVDFFGCDHSDLAIDLPIQWKS